MQQVFNGMPASDLGVRWVKSAASGANGNCVEFAQVPGGGVAIRNSRDPNGPALVYTRAEVAAFLEGAKLGEFDFLLAG
ncbi:DUF397 domain-containing protein [Streptomyces chrestomyceticus]|uniref:DUF397 domain-containing protein n=1 Tax=Streptomyces chrestomyceticus TaxID=68185 RepID=UPI0033D120D0